MNDFKVTRALPGDSLSQKIAVAGPYPLTGGTVIFRRGQMVQIDGAAAAGKQGVFDSEVPWKAAAGTRGFHLERDVVVGPIPFEQIVFNTDFGIADQVNPDTGIGYASARKVQEFEIEGADLVDSSLDEDTAIGTAVTAKAGKVGLKGGGDELYGYVRAQLAPHDAANNDFRLAIEVVE